MSNKQQFIDHLKKSHEKVINWPSWKKEMLGVAVSTKEAIHITYKFHRQDNCPQLCTRHN